MDPNRTVSVETAGALTKTADDATLNPAPSRRYFALDSLRATMMLLGIYLHSVVAYSPLGGWPYKDTNPTSVYDWTLGYIHAFRMPLFYVMAGFFAAFLTYRRGLTSFLRNRLQRILIPFVVGWTVMFPVVMAMGTYARAFDQPHPWAKVYHVLVSGGFLRHLHPLHLWFLEYLIFLYILQAFAFAFLPRLLPAAFLAAVNQAFRWLLKSPGRPLILAIPMFLLLCRTQFGYLEDPPGFVPVFRVLAPYVLTFTFGWFLYKNVDLLPEMQRFARTQVVATIGVGLLFAIIGPWMEQHRREARLITAGAVSLVMWLSICGSTGVFLRYLDRPMPRMRYLADSSYWLYIVHMPALMLFEILLQRVPWPAALKVWLVLAFAIPLMLLTYHFFVRPTIIGQILNGRRYSIRESPLRGNPIPAQTESV